MLHRWSGTLLPPGTVHPGVVSSGTPASSFCRPASPHYTKMSRCYSTEMQFFSGRPIGVELSTYDIAWGCRPTSTWIIQEGSEDTFISWSSLTITASSCTNSFWCCREVRRCGIIIVNVCTNCNYFAIINININIFVLSCNWIICQSSQTLENLQNNSLSKSFKLTSRVPRCILSLANTFLDFFKDKIERIRTKFSPSDSPDPFLFPPSPPPKLINFIPATLTEIHKLISASENNVPLIPSQLSNIKFQHQIPNVSDMRDNPRTLNRSGVYKVKSII